MPADLLLYAIIAGGLVFWLRSILGTRHGEERDRSEAFDPSVEEAKPSEPALHEQSHGLSAEESIRDLAEHPTSTLSVANKKAENGLLDIAQADRNFEVIFFLEAAQDVFVMVVEGFAKGDRELLDDLLGEEVYNAFDGAIAAREKAGETMENEIHAIRKAEIMDAVIENKKALITVRFIADEISVTKDEDGEIIAGHPSRTAEMRDIWTFSRDVKSRDPRWLVAETKGDFDGDNETIPNTH